MSSSRRQCHENAQHGKHYRVFRQAALADPTTVEFLRKWVDDFNKTRQSKKAKTATGEEHTVIQFSGNDFRVPLPKTLDFSGKTTTANAARKGESIACRLQKAGFDQEKVTYTWVVSLLSNLNAVPENEHECSHRCCELDENRNRMSGTRCVDERCLVWESKSKNQGRANDACRLIHCDHCKKTVCAVLKVHDPPCI